MLGLGLALRGFAFVQVGPQGEPSGAARSARGERSGAVGHGDQRRARADGERSGAVGHCDQRRCPQRRSGPAGWDPSDKLEPHPGAADLEDCPLGTTQ